MKKYYFILGAIQSVIAIGAIPVGYVLLKDPSGAGMGMSTEMLAHSPLDSFLLPGLFLLLINGLANLVAAVFSFSVSRYAGYSGFLLGIALTLWIVIQVWWISLSHMLQPLFFVLGLVNTWLGWKITRHETSRKAVSA